MPAINELPMMPGDDTLRPEDRSPEPVSIRVNSGDREPVSDWDDSVNGCNCQACQQARARQLQRTEPVSPAPMLWESSPIAIPDLGAQPFQTVTGRSRASAPVMQDLPRVRPYNWAQFPDTAAVLSQGVGTIEVGDFFDPTVVSQHPPTNRISGRYWFPPEDSAAYEELRGAQRWREPGTMTVFDAPVMGRRQWSYTEELPDGTLVDRSNRRWIPD